MKNTENDDKEWKKKCRKERTTEKVNKWKNARSAESEKEKSIG